MRKCVCVMITGTCPNLVPHDLPTCGQVSLSMWYFEAESSSFDINVILNLIITSKM